MVLVLLSRKPAHLDAGFLPRKLQGMKVRDKSCGSRHSSLVFIKERRNLRVQVFVLWSCYSPECVELSRHLRCRNVTYAFDARRMKKNKNQIAGEIRTQNGAF